MAQGNIWTKATWRPFCFMLIEWSKKNKIQLGNRAYCIQHTQVMLKSAVTNFYPKIHLKVYREPFSWNPSILRGILSVCSSVRLSVRLSVHQVPLLCPDEWRYDRAVFSICYDNPSSFWRVKCIRNSQGITTSGGVKVRHYHVSSENLTNNRP